MWSTLYEYVFRAASYINPVVAAKLSSLTLTEHLNTRTKSPCDNCITL